MHAIATQYTFLWVRKKELFLFSFIWIFLKLKKKKENCENATFSILITDYIFLIFNPKRDEGESWIDDHMKLRL